MKVLVTGGAGFIGSHVCERLLEAGHSVSVVDDLNNFYSPDSKRANLAQIARKGQVDFHQQDICRPEEMLRIVRIVQPEAILHLAARAGVRASIEDPLLCERVNVYGTLSMLEAMRHGGVRKLVFASSSSIYGDSARTPFREDDAGAEPLSPYAATKIAGEKLCYTYAHLHDFQVCCLRFFTVYGPRQRPDLAIHKFTALIEQGRPVPVFGSGASSRDYTYVDDIVSGVMAALAGAFRYEVFNLGNSSPVSLSEMIVALERALGKRALLERLPDQPGDMERTCADISKAERLLGYRPRTPFDDGLMRFTRWYRAREAQDPGVASGVLL